MSTPSDQLTDDDLRRLLELEAKATAGEWYSDDGGVGVKDQRVTVADCTWRGINQQTQADADFIAAARNSIRPLILEVMRLREERDSLAAKVVELENVIHRIDTRDAPTPCESERSTLTRETGVSVKKINACLWILGVSAVLWVVFCYLGLVP